jgi:hypothetical protein
VKEKIWLLPGQWLLQEEELVLWFGTGLETQVGMIAKKIATSESGKPPLLLRWKNLQNR